MLAEELAYYLQGQGLGTYDKAGLSGNIFIDQLPNQPDQAIGIYHRGGAAIELGEPFAHPALQIIVRSVTPHEGVKLAERIIESLHGVHEQEPLVEGGTLIISCTALQSVPNYLGKDSNNRWEYSVNFQFEIQTDDL